MAALALLISLPFARRAYSAFGESAGVALEVMERMTADLAAPPVAFYVRNDLRQEDPFLGPGEDRLKDAGAWQVQIFDQDGRKISYVQGRGAPEAAVIHWAGLSASGQAIPDGFYKARFVWLDAAGRPHATDAATVSLATPLELRRLSAMNLRVEYTAEGLVLTFKESMIFRPGEAGIKEEALPALDEIAGLLKAYPENRVLVRGYTDALGTLRNNMALSGLRAAGICRYLEASGIMAGRLASKGMGPARPLASNATEAGRARNRRVEVVVLKTAG